MAATAPDLWVFFVMVLGIIALPGMDMAFIAGSTLTGGRRGGALALLGVLAGGAVHTLVAAAGVATVLRVWPAAFNLLLLAGAAYMAWIGWQILRSQARGLAFEAAAPRAALRTFARGAWTCLLNPKAYLFMLAVFPAWMQAPGVSMPWQAARLGLIIAGIQLAVYGLVVCLVAALQRRAGVRAHWQQIMVWGTGGLLIVGALITLATGWRGM